MKKILTVLAAVLLYAGCAGPAVHPADGLYTKDGETPGIDTPYLILRDEDMTYIMNVAVSYQPSGRFDQNGGMLILKTEYLDQELVLSFRIRDEDTLVYQAAGSVICDGMNAPVDGTVFRLYDENDD
ncbi:MAG: hypothetical protein K6G61_08895 [Solobacterium sp.]|nr:hypothetical protein [Solobacterium sp.]